MSATDISAQEVASLYLDMYSGTAAFALLVYHWLLCLNQEVTLIWNRRSGLTVFSLMYALSRYPYLIQYSLSIATIYPMSDLSCTANAWGQTAARILGMIAFSAFSALRAYTLLNRNMWFTAVILLLALPPTALYIVLCFYGHPKNMPSPFNCGPSSSLPPTMNIGVQSGLRGSQFAAELLVVGVTWWYSYQSYRIRKGINLGQTLSSLLIYNGSIYFLILAILYISDIIYNVTPPGPGLALDVISIVGSFVDPMASILVCHFMLLLRQFDSSSSSSSSSTAGGASSSRSFQWAAPGSSVRQATSTVLEFAAQPSDSLPAYLASFANPVHVDPSLCDTMADLDGVERREIETDAF